MIALDDILPDMKQTLTSRQFAGVVVRDEIARQRLGSARAAETIQVSTSTLYRVINGDEKITDFILRQVEGGLKLPRHLLSAIIALDMNAVEAMPMDEDLRRYVVAGLTEIKTRPPDADGRGKQRRRG